MSTDLYSYVSFQKRTAPEVSSSKGFAVYTVRLPSNGSVKTFVLTFSVPQMNEQFHPSGKMSSMSEDQKNILYSLYNFSASALVIGWSLYLWPPISLWAMASKCLNCFVLVIISVVIVAAPYSIIIFTSSNVNPFSITYIIYC